MSSQKRGLVALHYCHSVYYYYCFTANIQDNLYYPAPPVKNQRILYERNFPACMSLLMAASAFGLGRRNWSSLWRCYFYQLCTSWIALFVNGWRATLLWLLFRNSLRCLFWNSSCLFSVQGQGYVSRSSLIANLNWEDERIMRALVSSWFDFQLLLIEQTCSHIYVVLWWVIW